MFDDDWDITDRSDDGATPQSPIRARSRPKPSRQPTSDEAVDVSAMLARLSALEYQREEEARRSQKLEADLEKTKAQLKKASISVARANSSLLAQHEQLARLTKAATSKRKPAGNFRDIDDLDELTLLVGTPGSEALNVMPHTLVQKIRRELHSDLEREISQQDAIALATQGPASFTNTRHHLSSVEQLGAHRIKSEIKNDLLKDMRNELRGGITLSVDRGLGLEIAELARQFIEARLPDLHDQLLAQISQVTEARCARHASDLDRLLCLVGKERRDLRDASDELRSLISSSRSAAQDLGTSIAAERRQAEAEQQITQANRHEDAWKRVDMIAEQLESLLDKANVHLVASEQTVQGNRLIEECRVAVARATCVQNDLLEAVTTGKVVVDKADAQLQSMRDSFSDLVPNAQKCVDAMVNETLAVVSKRCQDYTHGINESHKYLEQSIAEAEARAIKNIDDHSASTDQRIVGLKQTGIEHFRKEAEEIATNHSFDMMKESADALQAIMSLTPERSTSGPQPRTEKVAASLDPRIDILVQETAAI